MKISPILIVSIGAIFAPYLTHGEIDQGLINDINVAFEEGENGMAFGILLSELKSKMNSEFRGNDYDAELADFAYCLISNRFDEVRTQTTQTNLTTFSSLGVSDETIQALKSSATLAAAKAASKKWYDEMFSWKTAVGLYSGVGLTTLQVPMTIEIVDSSNKELARRRKLLQSFPPIPLPDDTNIKKVLERYDEFKEVLSAWIKSEELMIVQRKNLRQHIQSKKRLETLKQTIIDERTRFLSYVAFSPVLAETSRQLWIANQQFVGHDKDETKNTVEFLAKHTQTNWPRECSEDVRKQWFEVLQQLNGMVRTAEKQEYETLAGILKPNSDETLGGKAWWH